MGREVGGGIGMGKTCEPKAFSFQCMTKFTTKKKKNIFFVFALSKVVYFFTFMSMSLCVDLVYLHIYADV